MRSPGVEPISPRAPELGGPLMMNQNWRDLTFLHWAVEPEMVADRMPPGVRPDTLDGVTYVGLIPFRMVGAGIAGGPGVPWLGSFLETNVRLYSIDDTGRRGIVFLSLDADRAAVVVGARAAFGLPYRWARMRHHSHGSVHSYDSRLRLPAGGAESHIVIRAGARRESTELDDFVSARWGLHVRWWGRTLYVPNHHEAWPVHDAEVLTLDDTLMASVGLPDLATRPPDHVAFSPGVYTEFGFPSNATHPRQA
ncbi:YqjF family protein [Tessaracoccus sp.]